MKPIDQNNDNLEQFFKNHLDNYSSDLSPDFWTDIEGVIPPKPPYWALWIEAAKQFLFPTILLSSLIIISLFFWNTIQENESLSLLSAGQQMKIELIERQNEVLKNQLVFTNFKQRANLYKLNAPPKTQNLPKTNQPEAEKNALKIFSKNTASNSISALTTKEKNKSTKPFLSSSESNINPTIFYAENAAGIVDALNTDRVTPKNHISNPITGLAEKTALNNIITFLSPNKIPLIKRLNPKIALSQIAEIKGVFQPKGRYSFEGGILAFAQRTKIIRDTIPFQTGFSYGVSLLMNFELTPLWNIQSGFQIKSIESLTITRNYHSFPLNLKRKFVLNNKITLEPRLGLGVNFLVNAKKQDVFSTLDVAPFYMDVTSSLAFVIPFNKNLHFVIEPNIGYSVTPIVENEKVLSYGLHLGIRYEN